MNPVTSPSSSLVNENTSGYQPPAPVKPAALQHIPGDEGWPLLGLLPKYFYQLDTLMADMQRRFGNVARMRIPGSVGLFVFGANNFQRIMLDKEQLFSAREGLKPSLGHLFTEALLLQDYADHRVQRRLMQGAFKKSALEKYPALMNPIIASELANWSKSENASTHEQLKSLLLKISAKTFFGIAANNSDTEYLSQHFTQLVDAMLALVKWDVPGFRYHRGLRSRRSLEAYFNKVIPQRRTGDGQDMLSHMCRETKENGDLFSSEEIINQSIFLLFAAHDTTTSVLNNLLLHLALDPGLQNKVREESLAIGTSPLGFGQLDSLPLLDHCMDECLRLYPPAAIAVRATLRDCEIEGHQVPAGTTLYLPVIFNQRDPRFWSEPDRFDPERFNEERQEHKQHAFAYHPFGGGAHKCIGMHFARMMTKCVMHQLLVSQSLSLPVDFRSKHLWLPLPRPVKLPLAFSSVPQ